MVRAFELRYDMPQGILNPFWVSMRVLFVAQYGPLAASSRTRVFQYCPYLEAEGVEADVNVVIPDRLVELLLHRGTLGRLLYLGLSFLRTVCVGCGCVLRIRLYDRVLIQKVLFPGPIALMLRPFRSRILYDFDDAIFTTDESQHLLGRLSSWRRRRSLPRMLAGASTVVVENDYTADYARQFCDHVETITGPIDTRRYTPCDRPDGVEVVLGWIGSPTTTAYLNDILSAIARVAEERPHLVMRLVGASVVTHDRIRIEHRSWSLESEVSDLASFDVGLMPLPDDSWTRGKGGYKLLQYGAMGLPVVASPVGVNTEIVEEGITGFLADSEDDWFESLLRLVDDEELRSRMGNAGRDRIVERYSLDLSSRRLIGILKNESIGSDTGSGCVGQSGEGFR